MGGVTQWMGGLGLGLPAIGGVDFSGIIIFGICFVAFGGWGGTMDGRLGIGVDCNRGR